MTKQSGKRVRCRVYSGSGYPEAAPLRHGSPWCNHHRRRCKGVALAGRRCCITSSSQNTHAEPLRQGAHFCAHHAAQAVTSVTAGTAAAASAAATVTVVAPATTAPVTASAPAVSAAPPANAAASRAAATTCSSSSNCWPEPLKCDECYEPFVDRPWGEYDDDGCWYCVACWSAWDHSLGTGWVQDPERFGIDWTPYRVYDQ